MSITKTLGGDRISSGKKMKVEMHGYERSTHNLSKAIRTTMSSGTVVPIMDTIGLSADTWDLELEADVITQPTVGPALVSYKIDIHVFSAPIRLYNALLHNNMLGIGRDMSQAKLPQIEMTANAIDMAQIIDLNTCQINPSSLLSYMGIKGVGFVSTGDGPATRLFNATSILSYWETIKNYYANKQEEIGAVIHTQIPELFEDITNITLDPAGTGGGPVVLTTPPAAPIAFAANTGLFIQVNYLGTPSDPSTIYINTQERGWITADQLSDTWADTGTELQGIYHGQLGTLTLTQWRYRTQYDLINIKPTVHTFPLSNIDDMRYAILSTPSKVAPFLINNPDLEPYKFLYEQTADSIPNVLSSQEGLAVKTYLSDIYNNWLNTENINAITNQSSIDTSGGFFTLDQLLVGKAVWTLLNRINVSGGTYDDWLEVVYDHTPITRCESPMYHGGLIKELIFQEVVSNSETASSPLGTLAGKGTVNGNKGGRLTIKCDEPCVILALASLTPRLDYSQGNEWHTELQTLDDLHKPQFDRLGFQDLPTNRMAWWDSAYTQATNTWNINSAGKQPAWINYMTDTNKVFGNFAIKDNQMFMVANRRYEPTDDAIPTIKDLTTYIDPSKFNFIFAQTAIDAQNFMLQVGIKATVRRKMSAKIMPTL